MQITATQWIGPCAMTGLLAACGGGGSGGDVTAADPIRMPGQHIAAFDTLGATIAATPFTPAFDVETGMNVSYDGYARIRLFEGTQETTVLHGVADLSADISDADILVSGTLDDFSDETALYEGSIALTAGFSNREPGGNFSFPVFAGTLTRATGETIEASGQGNLRFFGPEGEFLRGGGNFAFARDGSQVDGNLTIVAETD